MAELDPRPRATRMRRPEKDVPLEKAELQQREWKARKRRKNGIAKCTNSDVDSASGFKRSELDSVAPQERSVNASDCAGEEGVCAVAVREAPRKMIAEEASNGTPDGPKYSFGLDFLRKHRRHETGRQFRPYPALLGQHSPR